MSFCLTTGCVWFLQGVVFFSLLGIAFFLARECVFFLHWFFVFFVEGGGRRVRGFMLLFARFVFCNGFCVSLFFWKGFVFFCNRLCVCFFFSQRVLCFCIEFSVCFYCKELCFFCKSFVFFQMFLVLARGFLLCFFEMGLFFKCFFFLQWVSLCVAKGFLFLFALSFDVFCKDLCFLQRFLFVCFFAMFLPFFFVCKVFFWQVVLYFSHGFFKLLFFSEKSELFFFLKKSFFYMKKEKRGRSFYLLCFFKVSLKKCSFNRKFFLSKRMFSFEKVCFKVAVFSKNEKSNFERKVFFQKRFLFQMWVFC